MPRWRDFGRGEWARVITLRLLLRDIWDSIRAGPARASLSYLAVTIGIASLVVLGAVLSGLRERAGQMRQELGGNVLAIESSAEREARRAEPLSRRDRDTIAASIPSAVVSCVRRYDIEESDGLSINVLEADEYLAVARDWTVTRGRFLDRLDIEGGARHMVISEDLSSVWRAGVGDVVRLQGEAYVVVGVIGEGMTVTFNRRAEASKALGTRTVLVPYTARHPWQPAARTERDNVDALYVRFPGNADVEAWAPVVAQLLGGRGRNTAEWAWTTPQRLIAGIRRIQRAIQWAGGSIAFLSLMLGGTTLMSLMVANVRERISEIGLRRALGATPRDIAALFVVEAWLVMFAAGATGLLVAGLLLIAIRDQLPVPYALTTGVFGLPFVAAFLIGTAFAYWPAATAARISPAEALRND
jgi:putative ABC transport system permease protein